MDFDDVRLLDHFDDSLLLSIPVFPKKTKFSSYKHLKGFHYFPSEIFFRDERPLTISYEGGLNIGWSQTETVVLGRHSPTFQCSMLNNCI